MRQPIPVHRRAAKETERVRTNAGPKRGRQLPRNIFGVRCRWHNLRRRSALFLPGHHFVFSTHLPSEKGRKGGIAGSEKSRRRGQAYRPRFPAHFTWTNLLSRSPLLFPGCLGGPLLLPRCSSLSSASACGRAFLLFYVRGCVCVSSDRPFGRRSPKRTLRGSRAGCIRRKKKKGRRKGYKTRSALDGQGWKGFGRREFGGTFFPFFFPCRSPLNTTQSCIYSRMRGVGRRGVPLEKAPRPTVLPPDYICTARFRRGTRGNGTPGRIDRAACARLLVVRHLQGHRCGHAVFRRQDVFVQAWPRS